MSKMKPGYQKSPKKKKRKFFKKSSYISDLVIPHKKGGPKKVTLAERIVKLFIYLALRLVIRPRKWKHPEKNYEIIDRTYQRIMSADFIFIPSSIAFYLIMAFMPILSMIIMASQIPGLDSIITRDAIGDVVGKFIPGLRSVIYQVSDFESSSNLASRIGGWVSIFLTLVTSTWVAAAGFSKIIYTQSYIYEHKFVGGYWMNRLKGMLMVLSLTLGLIFALVINILITREIDSWSISKDARKVIEFTYLFIGLFFLIFIGMVALFKLSPRYRIRIKHVIPGAMVTTLPTTIFLSLFGVITSIWSYGSYGVIGVIMYVGMACLIFSNFLFMGLISNAAYYNTFVGRRLEPKRTLSRK